MTPEELEVAKLAAATAGELKKVDSSMMERSSRGPANKLNPRSFITGESRTNNTMPINNANVIQAPVSRPAGAEVIGHQPVNVNELLIPMPDDMKDKVSSVPQISLQQPNPPVITHNPPDPISIENRLAKLEKKVNRIDKKINTILKKLK